jgi:hypothetical protein
VVAVLRDGGAGADERDQRHQLERTSGTYRVAMTRRAIRLLRTQRMKRAAAPRGRPRVTNARSRRAG